MESARSYVTALGAAVLLSSTTAHAQRLARTRPEFRADVIMARGTTIEGGVGLAKPVGTYTRLVGVVAGGVTIHERETVSAFRTDIGVRFLLDPFWESRWSLYGTGGIGVLYDEREQWRSVAIAIIGIEGARTTHPTPAFELGLGGGVRIGFALRVPRGDLR